MVGSTELYGNTSRENRYQKADPSTRNGGGPPDPETNLDQDSDHDTIQCPVCGNEDVGNLPDHIHGKNCNPDNDDSELSRSERIARQHQSEIRSVLEDAEYDLTNKEITEHVSCSKDSVRRNIPKMEDVTETRTLAQMTFYELQTGEAE